MEKRGLPPIACISLAVGLAIAIVLVLLSNTPGSAAGIKKGFDPNVPNSNIYAVEPVSFDYMNVPMNEFLQLQEHGTLKEQEDWINAKLPGIAEKMLAAARGQNLNPTRIELRYGDVQQLKIADAHRSIFSAPVQNQFVVVFYETNGDSVVSPLGAAVVACANAVPKEETQNIIDGMKPVKTYAIANAKQTPTNP